MPPFDAVLKLLRTAAGVFVDLLTFFRLTLRTPPAVAAENLFLRKQLALYVERKARPHRATNAIRFTMAQLSKFFRWRDALIVVKPDTLIRWHRKGFRLFWKWKSKPTGRPRVPIEIRKLICEMAPPTTTASLEVSLFHRPGFVDREFTSADFFSIELRDGFFHGGGTAVSTEAFYCEYP